MTLYMVSFQTHAAEMRQKAAEQISSLPGEAWNAMHDVWVVETDLSGRHIRDALRPVVGGANKVIVALLAGWAAWHGFDGPSSEWLERHL
jgi:hypothetical protein